MNAMDDFQRDISYRCRRMENGTIILTGTLRDGFHDIETVITVDAETLEIIETAIEFRKCPTADCRNVANRLKLLEGFVIGRGLNRKFMEVLGDANGCGNIRNILLALLPLAMNVRASKGIEESGRCSTRFTSGCAAPVPDTPTRPADDPER